ncbi:S41 family peptidase [Tissierella sp. Yu-01]|uniref:S41 family peptidase n=1 Tax=Tissierella sp. Yu-01 TaxID=3035694 RepID=UPI00240E48B6|nr:S41 family peptidase [Tissierella sp. Yu-01]WFA09145.1 S41 family peptidase [Tissierella sp. Yu-01]
MSNKKPIMIVIVLLIITNIITFSITNLVTLSFNDKVVIPKTQYEQLKDIYEDFGKVMAIREYIDNSYLREVDEDSLLDGQLKGMVQALEDPYSVYMTNDEFTSFTQETAGVYGGIGVVVTPGDDNLITVVSPIEGTPGERAGLKTGDKIIKVNGVEYPAEKMDEAVAVMKGEPNTKVSLTIMRPNRNNDFKEIDLEITREIIRLITVKSDVIDNNIGYLKITSFDEITYEDFMKELESLKNSNVEGIVLDLRNNPGGLLNICADIADELLGEGDIVYTQTKNGERDYLKSDKNKINIPLVVLVNEGSASASEILAGAIKDHERGELVGTTTFGKGVVQRIRDLGDGTGLKLTVSEYFTPKGVNIHGIGITPDIVIELNEEAEGIGSEYLEQDNQLQKAIEVLKSKI